MLLALLKIIFGIIILSWSADKLVSGACTLAKILGVSPLLIGLTIVAVGTSLPEMVVSILASFNHNSGIAIGNAIGSNITNIGLVIGLCAIAHPLAIESSTVRKEMPILILYTILISGLISWLGLNYLTSSLMLFGALIYIHWLIARGREQRALLAQEKSLAQEVVHELPRTLPLAWALSYIILGITLLPIAANILISGASEVARLLHISETVIGLTVVALGTSLPELAASLAATLKKEDGLAIGNIVGSNIFNLTGVLCPVGYISPDVEVERLVLIKDIPIMILLTLIFVLFSMRNKTNPGITRFNGTLFLFIYFAYIASFFVDSITF